MASAQQRGGPYRFYIGLAVIGAAILVLRQPKNECEELLRQEEPLILRRSEAARVTAADYSAEQIEGDAAAAVAERQRRKGTQPAEPMQFKAVPAVEAQAGENHRAVPTPQPPVAPPPVTGSGGGVEESSSSQEGAGEPEPSPRPPAAPQGVAGKKPHSLISIKDLNKKNGFGGGAAGGPAAQKQSQPQARKETAPPPERDISPGEKFLLTPLLNQQFASALQQGLMRFLKTAALTGRTAVLPQAKFDDPGFRFVPTPEHQRTEDRYFELDTLVDLKTLITPQWSCLKTAKAHEWSRETHSTVDLFLFITSKSCPLNWLRRAQDTSAPLKNVTFISGAHEEKIVDVIRGRMSVKEIRCVAADISLEEFKTLTAPHRTVMISQAHGNFLRSGFTGICGHAGIPIDFPKVSPPFDKLADKFLQEKFGDTGSHACVQLRIEKLVRMMILKKIRIPWVPLKDGSANTAPKLDQCIKGVLELSNMVAKQADGLFIMHDMHEEFGTVTTHFDGYISVKDYRDWSGWVTETMKKELPKAKTVSSYCGSEQHTKDTETNSILRENPRSCAMVEAAICMKAKKRMRMGNGSFGGFVTGIPIHNAPEGPNQWGYFHCKDVVEAAAKCVKTGKCKELNIARMIA